MRLPRVELPHWSAEPRPERSLYGPILVWVIGLALPIPMALYAFTCMFRAEVVIGGYAQPLFLNGVDAVIFGIAILAFAVLLHCACLWDSFNDSTPTCAKAKLLCLGIMGACAYALCFRMLPGLWQ